MAKKANRVLDLTVPASLSARCVNTTALITTGLISAHESLLRDTFRDVEGEEEQVRVFRLKAKELRRALSKCRMSVSFTHEPDDPASVDPEDPECSAPH
jgi:hypothetical protein